MVIKFLKLAENLVNMWTCSTVATCIFCIQSIYWTYRVLGRVEYFSGTLNFNIAWVIFWEQTASVHRDSLNV